jgi:hypothetical protein
LIVLIRSPEDLMKHQSLWSEEDAPSEKREIQAAVKPPAENKVVRRGKHEILYGAHSENPDASAQSMYAAVNTSNETVDIEVRKGGDILFNKVIRSFHRWLTAAGVGARRVTLVSCRWTAGMDFSLSLDGDAANFISHVSLEPTGMNPQCTALLTRIKQSFKETVSVETGPLISSSRAIVFDVVCSDKSPSAWKFQTIPRPPQDEIPPVPLMRKKLVLNGGPKIIYLSSDEACIQLNTSGCGYVCCTLYEVPCMVGYADVHRIIETELSSLHILKKLSNRFIGNYVESTFTFRALSSFCAYCVIITTSEDDPSVRPETPESIDTTDEILKTPPFVHYLF